MYHSLKHGIVQNRASFFFLCFSAYTYVCGCSLFVCMYYMLWMTSSDPAVHSRGVWPTSGPSYTPEPWWCLSASFTYNNIQVSPLPNAHTQTIHSMLNLISIRVDLCMSVLLQATYKRTRSFVSGLKKAQVSQKTYHLQSIWWAKCLALSGNCFTVKNQFYVPKLETQKVIGVRNMQRCLQWKNRGERSSLRISVCVCVHTEGSGMIKQSTSRYSMPSVLPHLVPQKFTPPARSISTQSLRCMECQNERGLV